MNANLANGGIREQRWRFQAKCLSESVPGKMGWNSQEKDKRMKLEVKCWSLHGPVHVYVCGHVFT